MEENKQKFGFLHSTVDAFDTFLRVPGTVTRKGAHVRDAIDLKRVMILVVIALVPAALFGMWNVGYQHNLATGTEAGFLATFFYGFLRVLPLFVVSYVVGLAIEFAGAQIKGEEVNEGYLVSGEPGPADPRLPVLLLSFQDVRFRNLDPSGQGYDD